MLCWGLNQGFTQWVLGFPFHDQWLPPVTFLKAIPGLLDGPVFMGWFPGRFISHKVGSKTFFDGNPAVQQGHDPGYLIPHWTIPMSNLMIPVNMLTSKHKVEVPVTSVLVENKFMGTFAFMFLGLICSQPVSLPTGICIPFAGTVVHDMTWEDLIVGICFVLMDMAVDAIWSLIVKGDKWGKFHIGKGFPKWYSNMLKGIFDKAMVPNVKKLGLRLALPLLGKQMFSKVVDHFGKSWLFSPLLSGGVFQGSELLDGLPRSALPSVSVGRSRVQFTFFPKLGYRVANVTN